MHDLNNEKDQETLLIHSRKDYLHEYHKKRKERLGITKISISLTANEYDVIYTRAKEAGFTKGNRKNLPLAPFIKTCALKENISNTATEQAEEALLSLKELFRLIKNCTNNINQIAYSLNLEKYYQQNHIPRGKEQELQLLKDIYSKVSVMEDLISKHYYENKNL